MMAIQILLQNLLYDISQLANPWDRVDGILLKNHKNEMQKVFYLLLSEMDH